MTDRPNLPEVGRQRKPHCHFCGAAMNVSTTTHVHVIEDYSHEGWTCYLDPCPHESDANGERTESDCLFCGGFGWLTDEQATFQPDEGGVVDCPVCEGSGLAR